MSSNLLFNTFFKNKRILIISFLLSFILTLFFYKVLDGKKKINIAVFIELNDFIFDDFEERKKPFNLEATQQTQSSSTIQYYLLKKEKNNLTKLIINLKNDEKKIIDELNSLYSGLKVENYIVYNRSIDDSSTPIVKFSFSSDFLSSYKISELSNDSELSEKVKIIFEKYTVLDNKKPYDLFFHNKYVNFVFFDFQLFSIFIFSFFIIVYIANGNNIKKYLKF